MLKSINKESTDLSAPLSAHRSMCITPASARSTTSTGTANFHETTPKQLSVSTEHGSVDVTTPLLSSVYMNEAPFTNTQLTTLKMTSSSTTNKLKSMNKDRIHLSTPLSARGLGQLILQALFIGWYMYMSLW